MSSTDYGSVAGELADRGEEPDEDRWQEYQDGVATGQLNEDGSQREPDEPDWGAQEYAEHCDEMHAGAACDCPPPAVDAWTDSGLYSEEPPF